MANKAIIKILIDNNLKVTPQRTAVLEVILALNNHPTAENIIEYLRINYPHIPLGTVYKILDVFYEKGIVKKIKTDDDTTRYDAIQERHYHLYCAENERIEDYYDEDLNKKLDNYLKKKKIPNFKIKDIRLQIIGTFTDKTN
jgi:Fur family peroxide stress response transcriptional regulator